MNGGGANRKVSRSLVDASVSPGTGSHSNFKQSENQLKQKLDAIDTSFKLSKKKMSNETRELRQILFDLQRELKVSKSGNPYVATSLEDEPAEVKRQRKVTMASTPQGQLPTQELVPSIKSLPDASRDGSQGTTTKRRRKLSELTPHDAKVLIQEDDVYGRENLVTKNFKVLEENYSSGEKGSSVETEVVMLDVDQGTLDDCVKQDNPDSPEEVDLQTKQSKQDGVEQVISDAILSKITEQRTTEEPHDHDNTSSPRISGVYKDLRDMVDLDSSDPRVRTTAPSHAGMFSYSATNAQASNSNTVKRTTGTALSYGLSYSKHFNEDRKRSLSDSDANYRDSFKGRFTTAQSLPEHLTQHPRFPLPAPEPLRRTRRITVSGTPSMGARHLLDIGDISVTPFSPGTRRKVSTTGRGPSGGLLPLRRGTVDNEEMNKDRLEESKTESSRGRFNLSVATSHGQRQRRSSSVRKTSSSSLPPLKEDTRSSDTAIIANQWKNLENCRYLRRGDEELSIDDIFKKN